MRRLHNSRPRVGFTLVELLVVITILAILVSLIAGAVLRAMGKGDEVRVRNEISQLANAVQAFKQEFAVAYMPDTITLPPSADTTGKSTQFISMVWPRLNPAALSNANYWQTGGSTRQLSGHQALVFFLGGYRDGNIPIGFSSDPTDPMKPPTSGATAQRKGPYYQFPADRLKVLAGVHPSFMDIYGEKPYLYFSAQSAGNDYPNTAQFGVSPFVLQVNGAIIRYANPTGFQIISAGKNGAFGLGGTNWVGASGGATNKDGADDVSNFHPTFLGTPAQ